MMNRTIRKATLLALVPTLGLFALVTGCQDSTPETKVSQAPAPPPPPPAPKVASVESLMNELNIDRRVVLPEDKAPMSTEERKAVLELFDGFARGDSQTVNSYISFADRPLLADLVSNGQWKDTTSKITQIRLETGITPQGDPCVLAVIQSGTQFQPQLWSYRPGTDKTYTFDSVYEPPAMMTKLSGTDWIAAWYKIVEDEMKLADMPDEDLVPAQRILDEGNNSAGSIAPQGGSPGSPSPMRAPGGPSGPATTPGRGPTGPKKG